MSIFLKTTYLHVQDRQVLLYYEIVGEIVVLNILEKIFLTQNFVNKFIEKNSVL